MSGSVRVEELWVIFLSFSTCYNLVILYNKKTKTKAKFGTSIKFAVQTFYMQELYKFYMLIHTLMSKKVHMKPKAYISLPFLNSFMITQVIWPNF